MEVQLQMAMLLYCIKSRLETLIYFIYGLSKNLRFIIQLLANQSVMKKLQSLNQIKEYLSDTARVSKVYGKYVASYVSIFTMLMKTCKGRNKICELIQYTSDFYYHCIKYSQISQVQKAFQIGAIKSAIIALKLRNSMKNSRKIFKFLNFIDQISSIIKLIESNKPIFLKLIGIIENLMSCISGIFDNIIWGINIEVLDFWFAQKYKYFKANKYFFSLCKLIFKMLGSNFQHHHRIKEMKQIILRLREHKGDLITPSNDSLQLVKQYLKKRKQIRIQTLDAAISFCRVIMLVRKLKLPGYTFVTKILSSFMGLFSTFLSILKMIVDQPILVQIQQDKKAKRQKKIQDIKSRGLQSLEVAKRVRIIRSSTVDFR